MIQPKGGKTVVELSLPSGEEVAGEAICYYKDQFNRREGRIRALGKALHAEKQLTGINAFKETTHV